MGQFWAYLTPGLGYKVATKDIVDKFVLVQSKLTKWLKKDNTSNF